MPRWLTEDTGSVYPALGVVALVVLLLGWKFRDRAIPVGSAQKGRMDQPAIPIFTLSLVLFLLIALLAAGVRLIDYLVVTDREQIEQVIQEMADGVKARDTERVFRHVSRAYEGPPASNMDTFKEFARRYIEHGEVTDVVVWEFSFPEGVSPEQGTAQVLFYAKVKGGIVGGREELFYLVDATFRLDDDKRWRLQKFLLKNPAATNDILPMPR